MSSADVPTSIAPAVAASTAIEDIVLKELELVDVLAFGPVTSSISVASLESVPVIVNVLLDSLPPALTITCKGALTVTLVTVLKYFVVETVELLGPVITST